MRTNWPTVALKPERKALKGYIKRPGKRLSNGPAKAFKDFPVGPVCRKPRGPPHPPERKNKRERESKGGEKKRRDSHNSLQAHSRQTAKPQPRPKMP